MNKEKIDQPYNIIFLDVDGVLNNKAYLLKTHDAKALDPVSVALLRRLIVEVDGKVVLSSSWRFSQSHVGYLEKKLGFQFYDILSKNRIITRGENIRTWLKEHKESVKQYVIIDDDNDDIRDVSYFVKTSFDRGFGKEEYDKAVVILNQMRKEETNSDNDEMTDE